MPSKTVENYVKAIYLAQQEETAGGPAAMGQLARSLGVVPGTATTMVKSLSEAGLADYAPRVGVRLTAQGETLALRILRRHRLVELFLVRTLKLDWSEIHDEAEELEHAISDRVLDRLDAFLGFPKKDPHGDPIPTADGVIDERDLRSVADSSPQTRLKIARIADQDSEFLTYLATHALRPGKAICILERNEAADAVTLEREEGGPVTLGLSAAKKILVEPV